MIIEKENYKKLDEIHIPKKIKEFSSFYDEESQSSSNSNFKLKEENDFDKLVFDKYFFIGLLNGFFFNVLSFICYLMNHKKSYRGGILTGFFFSTVFVLSCIFYEILS